MVSSTGTSNAKLRILSMDGGGIYGMFTCMMLKELRLHHPMFLTEGGVDLLAGTSAGAVNSCLLAMHENPCDGLDTAIDFWGELGVYQNSNPFDLWVTSNLGLSPYFGTADYKDVLNRYFGDRTLGDLAYPVLLVSWNWAGQAAADSRRRQWQPKIFCNFPDDNPDRAAKLADVAFSVGAPSWFRCIYDGCQDGGWIAPNPALYAVTKVIDTLSRARGDEKLAASLPDGFRCIVENVAYDARHKHYGLRELISVFSLGVGAQQPFLPVSYANWGKTQWMNGMWNPYMGRWVSPMTSIALDGPTDAVEAQCSLLLNIAGRPDGFFRLNPRVLETPVMDVLIRQRNNPYYIEYIKKTIQSAVGKPLTREGVRLAELWLEESGWPGFTMPQATKETVQ